MKLYMKVGEEIVELDCTTKQLTDLIANILNGDNGPVDLVPVMEMTDEEKEWLANG